MAVAICGRCHAGHVYQEHRLGHAHHHLQWRGRLPGGAAGRKSLLLVFSPTSGSGPQHRLRALIFLLTDIT